MSKSKRTIAAAFASKHHWLIIACDACDTVIDLDLTVKRRDPDAPIRVEREQVMFLVGAHPNGFFQLFGSS